MCCERVKPASSRAPIIALGERRPCCNFSPQKTAPVSVPQLFSYIFYAAGLLPVKAVPAVSFPSMPEPREPLPFTLAHLSPQAVLCTFLI
jgi:hypothetical protein